MTTGASVRGRRLEWHKTHSFRNQEVIEQGNEAAHYGMAVTDALLYSDDYPAEYKRTDTSSYRDVYGVLPGFVLNLSTLRDADQHSRLARRHERFLSAHVFWLL